MLHKIDSYKSEAVKAHQSSVDHIDAKLHEWLEANATALRELRLDCLNLGHYGVTAIPRGLASYLPHVQHIKL